MAERKQGLRRTTPRPSDGEQVRIGCLIDAKTHRAVKRKAAGEITISEIIRDALRKYLASGARKQGPRRTTPRPSHGEQVRIGCLIDAKTHRAVKRKAAGEITISEIIRDALRKYLAS